MCGFWGSPGAVSLSKRPSKLSVLFIASKQGLLRRAVIQWHEGKNHMFRAQQDPTRLHVDGLRGHAGAHAIMVADSDSVELATFQVLYPAAGVSGAAAEKSLIFIHNAGCVGVHSGLSMPRNQSLIGCTVQGGSDVIRGASSWNEAKGQLTSTMKQNIIRLCTFLKWNTDTEFNHENQQLKILIKNSSVLSVFAQKLCVNNNNISFWDLQIWKFAFNPFNILQIVYTSLFSPSREHLRYGKITQKKKNEQPHSTCLYGDRLALRAVAHEVGGNDVRCVVGAALQALDLTGQIHGVAAVNDAIAVLRHGDVENCTAGHPGHCDGVGSTFLHCWYVPRSAGDWRRGGKSNWE